jgi:hypothetical protein
MTNTTVTPSGLTIGDKFPETGDVVIGIAAPWMDNSDYARLVLTGGKVAFAHMDKPLNVIL